jgi:hypothetical protein
MLVAAAPRLKAALNSLSLPHAGDWLNVVPTPALGLSLNTQEFRASAMYRLGLHIFNPSSQCPSQSCETILDELGDHALHSRDDHGAKSGRHNRLRMPSLTWHLQPVLPQQRKCPISFPVHSPDQWTFISQFGEMVAKQPSTFL